MSDMLIQEDPRIAAKRRLAQAAMEGGGAPIQSGGSTEAFARLAQTLIGAYMAKQAGDQEKGDRDKGYDAVAEAIKKSQSPSLERGPNGAVDASGFDPNTVGPAMPPATPDQRRGVLMDSLMKNPSTKQFAGRMALSQALEQPKDETLADGGVIVRKGPSGTYSTVASNPKESASFKVGQTRDVQRGTEKVTEEYQKDGTWKAIGQGPAYAPAQEPPPVEIDDPNSPTGRRLVPRADALNKPGPAQQSPQATANTLRDEFNKATEAPRTVASMYRNGVKAAGSASAAGDMGLIYSFMKALDPGSSVKEGEYAQGEQLTGTLGRFWQSYNKAKDGEKLLPEVRADILGQLKNIYTSHLPSYESAKTRYTDIATRQRVNPKDVVTDLPGIDDAQATGGGASANRRTGDSWSHGNAKITKLN